MYVRCLLAKTTKLVTFIEKLFIKQDSRFVSRSITLFALAPIMGLQWIEGDPSP